MTTIICYIGILLLIFKGHWAWAVFIFLLTDLLDMKMIGGNAKSV